MHRADGPARHLTSARRTGRSAARARHATSRGSGFGRFTGVTLLALVPGAGLFAAGRRAIGGLVLGSVALVLAAVGVLALSGNAQGRALQLWLQPSLLLPAAVAIAGLVLLWCVSILATAWAARPAAPSGSQRALGIVLVAALCAAVAAPGSVGVRYALIQRDLVTSLFHASDAGGGVLAGQGHSPGAVPVAGNDPWAGVPRVNMLLLGSDAGADRTGVRTDSMIVASINTKTGDTVLLGLPRSLQKVPFPKTDPLHKVWPNGFDCGTVCLLNAVWEQAATVHRDLFPGDPNPGLTATRDVIGEVLGLRIDYYTIVDLDGFKGVVDAMGGVEVDVRRRIPIGGGENMTTRAQLPIYSYIEPGRQRLNGYQALWFARSRQGSDDYDRMGRQRCMVTALLDQANPVQLLAKYPQLAKVAKKNVQTDIRRQDLAAWVTLVQRVQGGTIRSLPFTNKVISTVDPDFSQIRSLVTKAIDPAAPASSPKPPSAPKPAASPKPTASSKPTPGSTPGTSVAQDAASVC